MPTVMNNGFVPVATASPKSKVADPAHNAQEILQILHQANERGAKVVAFPEVTMTSYIANDLLYQDILLDSAEEELGKLVKETADLDILYSVGIPLCINGKIYNTLAICHQGKILGIVPKTYIPTYGVDFEGRWFHPGPAEVSGITVAGQENVPFGSHMIFRNRKMPQMCVGYEICEDIWSPDPPSIKLALAGATILINGSASDASLDKDIYRRGLIEGQSARLLGCYMYCSSGQGDSTGDVTVGGQEIIAENGTVLAQARPFGEGFAIADVDVESLWGARRGMSSFITAATAEDAGYHEVLFDMDIPEHELLRPVSKEPFVPTTQAYRDDCSDLVVKMQSHGLLARLQNQQISQITVDATGSGMLDLALALYSTVKGAQLAGLPSENVHVVTSATQEHDFRDFTQALTEALGADYQELAPANANAGKHSSGYTQTQAKTSGDNQLLNFMNSFGGVLINTCDMTELALGLVEFPVNIGRQYAMNCNLARTTLPYIIAHIASTEENETVAKLFASLKDFSDNLDVPQHDSFAQDDEAGVGPVSVQDFYLNGLLRAQYRPSKVFRLAKNAFDGEYTDAQLAGWLKVFYERFFATQFMRYSLPDGPRIGSAGLDMKGGFMMPSYAQPDLWLNEVDEIVNSVK